MYGFFSRDGTIIWRSKAKVMDCVRLISNPLEINGKAPQTPLTIPLHHSKEMKSGDPTEDIS